MRRWAVLGLTVGLILAGCGSDDEPLVLDGPENAPVAADCVVWLHGKGGDGGPTRVADGVAEVAPAGNGEGWGGREWRYDAAEDRAEAITIIVESIDAAGCDRAVVDGFSNGGAMAIALWCAGDDLDGRLVGVVADDPVPDAAASGCTPPSDVPVALYWTGDLEDDAPPGSDCGAIDWTCAGGSTRAISAVAADLGVDVQQSPFTEHRWFRDAPEVDEWLS